jgi:2-polyprenyl-6-methoxyphenol hydroxylase-like FAD-dependent oxidoreductase
MEISVPSGLRETAEPIGQHQTSAASASEISSEISSELSAEVVIVGAGLAGTALANVLGRRGVRVILLDPKASCAPILKAEKIEREQVLLLRKLGLLEHLIPLCGSVTEVHGAYDGRVFKSGPIEQYGIRYPEMVNALRGQMPATVVQRVGRVEAITNSGETQRVKLIGGAELTSRLVVLACGYNAGLQESLGMRRRTIQKEQSAGFWFDFAPIGAASFQFEALTYYSMSPATLIDYLTLFRFRDTMRANLFVFRAANDPWVRQFIQEPGPMLRRYLPKLSRVTGEYRVTSKVEYGRVDLYRVDCDPQPGIVMIGDTMQSACPAAGMGLDKVLTDVDVLSERIPVWLASPGMGADKLDDFYQHPRKLASDAEALDRARDHRRVAIDKSLRWRVHRSLLHAKWRMLGSSAQLMNAVGFQPRRIKVAAIPSGENVA